MKLNVSFTESNSSFNGKMSSNNAEFGCNHEDFLPISGPPGKSAYEVAKENGFVGTEKEWLASLKGEPGAPGTGGSALDIDAVVEAVEEKLNAGSLCVEFTGDGLNGYTADKTYSEIVVAHRAGKRVYGVLDGFVLDEVRFDGEWGYFAFSATISAVGVDNVPLSQLYILVIHSDNTVKRYIHRIMTNANINDYTPVKLPNPHALTIGGQSYDGSEAVTIDTTGSGETGSRGTGILKVTTAPSNYTTVTNGVTPIKRMALSTIQSQSGVSEVLVGDCICHSYYLYHIYYVDATYAYIDKSQSIRGATGAAGSDYVLTEADKTEIANIVMTSMPNANGVSF